MMVTSGLYAQSQVFIIDDDEYEEASEMNQEIVVDSATVETVEQNKDIPMTVKTWDNLEQKLKDEVIRLSKQDLKRKVSSKSNIAWIYQISQVPTSSGFQTIYLSILKDEMYGFFLSKENPNNVEQVCECYLDLTEISAGKKTTDDPNSFGEAKPTGRDRNIQTLW